jgi:hypothetical protein
MCHCPCRQSLFKAIVDAGLPEGLTAVRLDAYPKSEELQHGVSVCCGNKLAGRLAGVGACNTV